MRIPLITESDIALARIEGRAKAKAQGFPDYLQGAIATAISEIATNVIVYGGHGSMTLSTLKHSDGREGIEARFEDRGPGIPNIARAMTQGFTTGDSLGAGLSGAKRLMDEFAIENGEAVGLVVVLRKWLAGPGDLHHTQKHPRSSQTGG